MRVYTYSEARQRLATLLEQSRREGQVQIRRRDGQLFVVQPAVGARSPLDVPAIAAKLKAGELTALLRESRETGYRFWRNKPGRRTQRRGKRN